MRLTMTVWGWLSQRFIEIVCQNKTIDSKIYRCNGIIFHKTKTYDENNKAQKECWRWTSVKNGFAFIEFPSEEKNSQRISTMSIRTTNEKKKQKCLLWSIAETAIRNFGKKKFNKILSFDIRNSFASIRCPSDGVSCAVCDKPFLSI